MLGLLAHQKHCSKDILREKCIIFLIIMLRYEAYENVKVKSNAYQAKVAQLAQVIFIIYLD